MTSNGLLGDLAAWTGLGTAAPDPANPIRARLSTAGGPGGERVIGRAKIGPILDVCDRVLGETSQRSHLFDWLQPSGGAGQSPIAVDAYYPDQELVVLGDDQPEAHQ